jgi:hypothetical protein
MGLQASIKGWAGESLLTLAKKIALGSEVCVGVTVWQKPRFQNPLHRNLSMILLRDRDQGSCAARNPHLSNINSGFCAALHPADGLSRQILNRFRKLLPHQGPGRIPQPAGNDFHSVGCSGCVHSRGHLQAQDRPARQRHLLRAVPLHQGQHRRADSGRTGAPDRAGHQNRHTPQEFPWPLHPRNQARTPHLTCRAPCQHNDLPQMRRSVRASHGETWGERWEAVLWVFGVSGVAVCEECGGGVGGIPLHTSLLASQKSLINNQ